MYSACNYEGKQLRVCEDIPNLLDESWDDAEIKSLTVPSGYTLTLYSDAEYIGESKAFTANDSCLAQSFHLIAQGKSRALRKAPTTTGSVSFLQM